MKHLLIALLALTMTLGVGCKKSNDVADSKPSKEVKKEVVAADLRPNVLALERPDDGGGIGGANSFPHDTGACTCGSYATCHPREYLVYTWIDKDHGQWIPHLTQYGQTTFPDGAIFPGNTPSAE